jgi:hypothetical protein
VENFWIPLNGFPCSRKDLCIFGFPCSRKDLCGLSVEESVKRGVI